MRIHTMHWSPVSIELVRHWAPPRGITFALWPAPVDHDLCFQEAGFGDFADTDDTWDLEFEASLERLVGWLGGIGEPFVREGDRPVLRESLLHRLKRALVGKPDWEPTLADLVRCPIEDDNFSPCIVEFGQPPSAWLRTSDGHPLFWIHLLEPVRFETMLEAVAAGRRIVRTELEFSLLA